MDKLIPLSLSSLFYIITTNPILISLSQNSLQNQNTNTLYKIKTQKLSLFVTNPHSLFKLQQWRQAMTSQQQAQA
jgi:hypothetical protein